MEISKGLMMIFKGLQEENKKLRTENERLRSENCNGCDESTGETKLWCCNHCGKRIQEF